MSEYQYYEFQALDRRLTDREIKELRALSTRAIITPTRFTNFYTFGDFKGSPSRLIERYFDAFLYLANWGTHEFMLRFPKEGLDLKTAKLYCPGGPAKARNHREHLIFEFLSDDEEADFEEEGEGILGTLVQLRGDILSGDYRALYLAWLLCAQSGELELDHIEPPLPTGLGRLTGSLDAFADFLRVDRDLLQVAAQGSPSTSQREPGSHELKAWVSRLSTSKRDGLLVELIQGKKPNISVQIARQIRESHHTPGSSAPSRTVGELLQAAKEQAQQRRDRERKRAMMIQIRRDREAAKARDRYLVSLAKRGDAAIWNEVRALIATRLPRSYDQAVSLLQDLRELSSRKGRASDFKEKFEYLESEHDNKPGLLRRLESVGLK